VKVSGASKSSVAKRTATLVKELKESGKLTDYSQVALLLPSVRYEKSGDYIEAFAELGIPSYCPRAKAYFSNDEVKLMLGSIAFILDWTTEFRGDVRGGKIAELVEHIDESIDRIESEFDDLHAALVKLRAEVRGLGPTGSSDKRVADFPYLLLPYAPFSDSLKQPIASRNISKLTKLLAAFHQYYGYSVVTGKNLVSLRNSIFNSFFRFLYESGEDDVEDPDEMFPPGMVQIMTIHQSKGLEFPFVLVGGLEKGPRYSTKSLDELSAKYSDQVPFEPSNKIGEFDDMRLFYVAMSRPQHLLALLDPTEPKRHKRFEKIIQQAVDVTPSGHGLDEGDNWEFEKRLAPKKSFSFTSDVRTFETCARQYQMYRHLEFEPSRAVTIVFGTLVHQTIEDIHRMQLEGKGAEVDEAFIRDRFEFNLKTLMLKEVRYIGKQQQEAALNHVLNYWKNNQVEIAHVIEAEVDVTLEEEDFILNGSIDLVRSSDGELEILDFKSSTRPEESEYLDSYYQQLCIYAHVYAKRTGVTPSRLVLYWTGEFDKKQARMVFDYNPSDVEQAATHFREVVGKIQALEFDVVTPPDKKTCSECDFRAYCASDGTISAKYLK
jgi:DNA helicase-2/ATP-dependent DNA helicase PcrA